MLDPLSNTGGKTRAPLPRRSRSASLIAGEVRGGASSSDRRIHPFAHAACSFMPTIFISYRRDDAPGYAGRLHDRLAREFGRENVFIDIEALQPGDDFVEAIHKRLRACDVMLALIGRRWLSAADERGGRRLDADDDYVRLEIETALERKMLTIPILVERATMPKATELPPSLRAFARRQALELSDSRWEYDVGVLLRHIETAELDEPTSLPLPMPKDSLQQRPDPRVVNRPVNLGFDGAVEHGVPHGWFNSVGYVFRVSDRYQAATAPRRGGKPGDCLVFSREDGAIDEFGSLMQRFPAKFLAGRTVQFEGELKVEDVRGWAGLWMRADGATTADLVFDNMHRRPLRDTQEWARYSIEVNLPAETSWLNIGIVLCGSGTVYADDLRLRVWNDRGHWDDV
jgi:hypothetical protein